jgi:PAS domain S-box-containing protein
VAVEADRAIGAATGSLEAYMRAALDCVIMADASGRIVEFNPAAERTFGYTREEALGRTMAELIVPPSLRERHTRAFARFVETREPRLFGRRLELTGMRADGSEFPVELALSAVEGESLLICGALRDISDAKRAESDLGRLAAAQAALRRVATLVAQGAMPKDVLFAVAREVGQLLETPIVEIVRFDPDATATVVADWGDLPYPVGTQWTLEQPSVMATILETGRPGRIDDYSTLPGRLAERAQQAGLRCAVGAPIILEGKVWGAIMPASRDQVLPDDTEAHLVDFTELVATAFSNTQARDDLRRLADEQAALRRVATLIAREASPSEIFTAVAKEAALTLDVPLTAVIRYAPQGMATQVGAWGSENPFPIGTSWTLDTLSVSGLVFHTGRPARVNDYAEVPGEISSALAREAGIRTAVGAPILVDGRAWGAMMALSTHSRELPAETEARLAAFTELIATAISNVQARDDLRDLANEQSALRRVATLVAGGTDAGAVFDAVCAETGELIGAASVNLAHFTPDGFNVTMAGWSLRDTHVPTGTRLPLSADTINGLIQRTVAPARFDSYEDSSGELAALIRQRGIRSEVGAPVIVEGRVWGALIAGTDGPEPLPAGTERRLARFAELIATAISNVATRSELIASRARIVAASDEARRRIERNLHDGTQQRLLALGLDLQATRASVPAELHNTHADLERIEGEIDAVLEDVRELSRGLHPALLSQSSLSAAIKALVRRTSVPVELDLAVDQRLPTSIEIAAYYVVSEALANAAKHAGASLVRVVGNLAEGRLRLTIADDGVGGAVFEAGSGLTGLVDRVEALGGRLSLDSRPGAGTAISIELPIEDLPIEGEEATPVDLREEFE